MILIADDDKLICASLAMLLKRAGYETMCVNSPLEAIDVVKRIAPQLILMDMNYSLLTSGIEGITLLKQVKLFRPEVPVILITAWGSIDWRWKVCVPVHLILSQNRGIIVCCFNEWKRHWK